MVTESLINRARQAVGLLETALWQNPQGLTEAEQIQLAEWGAAEKLMKSGVSSGDAYLAVKAGRILLRAEEGE